MNKRRLLSRCAAVLAAVLLVVFAAFGVYVSIYYRADETVKEYLASETGTVMLSETNYGWFLDGPSDENAMVFYPGAKVDERAYIPLLYRFAEEGMDVCLVKMPFHLAVFGIDKADEVMPQYDYENWYIGGHSLGGAMAAVYAARHPENLTGVVLLAAYPTKQLDEGLQAVTVYGSEDRVLNRKKLEQGRPFLPEKAVWLEIPGGNHAQFGDYGVQKGDGTASISAQEQLRQTEDVILNMMNEASGT